MNIFASTHDAAQDRQNQIHRTLVGGMYGFLGGSAFTLIASLADLLFYRDLPMGIRWDWFLSNWPIISLAIAVIAMLTCWWGPAWAGLLAGAVSSGLIALVTALSESQTSITVRVIVLMFTIMPTAVMSLPIAMFLRWLVTQYGNSKDAQQKRIRLVSLGFVAILAGLLLGTFAKMPQNAATAVRVMQEAMETQADEVVQTPGYQEHALSSHQFFQQSSENSTEGFDVTALYEDGYALTCTVVVYPGSTPYLLNCEAAP
jgi:hypothetical protein